MFIPYISTYFSESRGYSVSFIGWILAIRITAQQGLAILGGLLAERFGNKTIAIIGFVMRGIGFMGLGIGTHGLTILISAALSGLGGAFFSPSLRATLAFYSNPIKQKDTYALMNMVENLGAVLGPMFGMILYKNQFDTLSFVTGGIFFVIALIYTKIPDFKVEPTSVKWISKISQIVKDRQYISVFFIMIPFYFMNQQLYLSIPIIAEKDTGSSSWLFPIFTLLIIFFQFPVSKIVEKRSIWFIFLNSYLIMALLFIPLSIFSNMYSIILSLIGISIGNMMLLPCYHSISISLAPSKGLVAAYIGFSNISMAIGGTLGNVLGGDIFGYLNSINQPNLFWLFLCLLSLLSVMIVSISNKNLNRNKEMKGVYNE